MVKQLTSEEKISIQCWAELNQTPEAIAKRMKRHPTTISRHLRRWDSGTDGFKRKNHRKLSEQDIRQIRRCARAPQATAASIKKQLNLNVTVRRIRQVLSDDPHLLYKRVAKQIKLTQKHKERRLQFAKTHLNRNGVDWDKVIITDEKKFNLRGPDGWDYRWVDTRRMEEPPEKKNNMGLQS